MKQIKNKGYAFLLLLLALINLVRCTGDFEEMNTNPNQFTNPGTDLILPYVIINTAYYYNGDALRNFGGVFGQYYVNLKVLSFDRFIESRGDYRYYLPIQHVNTIYQKAKELDYTNRMGVALVLKAFLFAELTDEMGDIPYAQAVNPEAHIYPVYDSQEDIYLGENGLLAILEEANTLLSEVNDGLDATADILYKGSVIKWRKLANSLRLRLLIRISGKADVKAKIAEIVTNPGQYPIFESNADNAELPYLNGTYSSPFGVSTNLGNTYYAERAACATTVDALKAINDPRLPVYYDPVPGTASEFVGIPAGTGSPSNYNGGEDFVSRLTAKFKQDANKYLPAKMLHYAEVMFLLAEAAQRQLIAGDAAAYYKKGIEASFGYWEVQAPAGYFDQDAVAYDGTLERIITQKWLANFCIGAEAWFDYRRTGFPDFQVGPATSLNGQFIQRLMYPVDEESTNYDNLQEVIARQGPNNNLTKMWYLK